MFPNRDLLPSREAEGAIFFDLGCGTDLPVCPPAYAGMLGCHDIPLTERTSLAEPLAVTRTPADVDLQAGIPLAQTLADGRGSDTSAVRPHSLSEQHCC